MIVQLPETDLSFPEKPQFAYIYTLLKSRKNPPTELRGAIRRPPLLRLLSSSLNLYWQKRPPLKAPAVIRRPLQSVERVRTSIYSSIPNPFNPSVFLPSLLAAQSFKVFNAPMPLSKPMLKALQTHLESNPNAPRKPCESESSRLL